jgi:hypothetical protein
MASRLFEVLPLMGIGFCVAWTGLFASRLAPTGESISNVGASLLAKAEGLDFSV